MKKFNQEALQKFRYITDDEADTLANQMVLTYHPKEIQSLMQWLNNSKDEFPLYSDDTISSFFKKISLPKWADFSKMKNGSLFFEKHEKTILFLLGTLSLPYCYAAKNGVQVLYLSQRLKNDTYKRLQETGEFVIKVSVFDENKIEEWKENILKIRILHAIARKYTQNHAKWNVAWGKPINQEDMAGTNLSFSYIVLRGMRKLGIAFSQIEGENFLHLWGVIGALMGVDDQLLPDTLQEAYWLDKTIVDKEFETSPEGQELTKALIKVYQEQKNMAWIGNYLVDQMRFLLGKNIADMLGVPASKVSNETSLKVSFSFIKNVFLTNQIKQ